MRCAPRRNLALSLSALMMLAIGSALPASAEGPPCNPCAGISVAELGSWLEPLSAAPQLSGEARLFVAWPAAAGDPGVAASTARVAATGAVPWLRLRLVTPAPIIDHLEAFERELEALSALARAADASTHYQIEWPTGSDSLEDYAFLFKRAAVALSGAQAQARVITRSLPPSPAVIEELFGHEIAAYADGIALLPGTDEVLSAAAAQVASLDPGTPVVVMARPEPRPAARALIEAAESTVSGVALTFFELSAPSAETLAPFKVLALEFQGDDLSYDPYSLPSGVRAWTFVRGEDLALRVIIDRADKAERIEFADTTLREPTQVAVASGVATELFGIRKTATGQSIPLEGEDEVVVLRLARPDLADLVGEGGLAEEVTITTERTMPVAEILRRLQANEDGQARALDHYEAVNTTHLRFQGSTGIQTVEATFEGAFFFEQGKPYDWAWQTFFVNGVKWRGKRIPEIPLIEPEKAATLPLEITFDRDYDYSLRGTATIDDRECWVVDFEPAVGAEGNRYQGTVWIDRQHFLRVRSRALQLGLAGEVISNEETLFYTPLAVDGSPTEWESAAFTLPLRIVSQQIFSVLNATTNVEKETLISGLRINAEGFEDRRQATYDSEATVVRDTERGLRYLIPDKETGERVVQEEFDKDRLFIVGGTFYDESLDYPLPLAGINYFSFDFRGTGAQANLFFAGVLAIGNLSDPTFLGSRFDAGVNIFGLAIPFTSGVYRDGVQSPGEDVRVRSSSVELLLGRPVGSYLKLGLSYKLGLRDYSRADATADDFVVPEDNLLNTLELSARYSRKGYRMRLAGSLSKRSTWKPWGLPDEPFDPASDEYSQWSVALAKTFDLGGFKKAGLELEYLGGQRLDRFSKYQFGYFSDSRVHGYQSELVQAEEALGLHTTYGFEIGELFRLDLVGDAVWATDEVSGLDRELLGGLGIAGTFIGPWQTVVNLDLGVPVAGPDKNGFTLFLAFLKLFG
jgi:hypothetical protein